MIGDWSRSDVDSALTTSTGVYGFDHGAVSYAFKDDGTAFIGKDGHGRILFDGTGGTIYSSSWNLQNNNFGIYIDLKESQMLIKGKPQNDIYSSHTYFEIVKPILNSGNGLSYDDKKLIHIGDNQYFLQSANFDTDRHIGTKIDLANGSLQGYNFNIYAQGTNGNITISSSSAGLPFVVQGTGYNASYYNYGQSWNYDSSHGGRFAVNWDGTISASGGTFGGVINAYGGTISGDLTVYGTITGGTIQSASGWGYGTTGYSLSGGKLTASDVKIGGEIEATKGKIGGWSIGQNTITGGSTTLNSDGTISAPFINTAYIDTGYGVIGYTTGNNGVQTTNLLGIISSANGVAIEGTNVRLSGGIWLDGTVHIGQKTLEDYIKDIVKA